MLYSKWLPDRGGYAYFESAEKLGLGDDLPVPSFRATSPIGVASTEVGRRMPAGARLVGYGDLARGSVVPLDRSMLSGALGALTSEPVKLAAVAACAAVLGVIATRFFR